MYGLVDVAESLGRPEGLTTAGDAAIGKSGLKGIAIIPFWIRSSYEEPGEPVDCAASLTEASRDGSPVEREVTVE